MDYDLILKIIKNKEKVTDKDLETALYDMCDGIHSSCNSNCLMISESLVKREHSDISQWSPFVAVYPEYDSPQPDIYGCPFFKNGAKMLRALKDFRIKEK